MLICCVTISACMGILALHNKDVGYHIKCHNIMCVVQSKGENICTFNSRLLHLNNQGVYKSHDVLKVPIHNSHKFATCPAAQLSECLPHVVCCWLFLVKASQLIDGSLNALPLQVHSMLLPALLSQYCSDLEVAVVCENQTSPISASPSYGPQVLH